MFHFAALARKRMQVSDDAPASDQDAALRFLSTYQPVFAASRSFMLLQSPAQANSSLNQSEDKTIQQ
jgi:hypothetical protein